MTVSCPSCGASLPIEERFAQVVACEHCHTLLVCDAERLRLAGTASVLPAGGSLFRVGVSGVLDGRAYTVMGRARWRYGNGHWDEWAIRFADDGSSAWIAEDGERITLEDAGRVIANPPAYDSLTPGRTLRIGTQMWRVIELGEAVVETIQGQLPRGSLPGDRIAYANLVRQDHYASLDYADGATSYHQGRELTRGELGLPAGEPVMAVEGKDLRCAQCASPLPAPAPGAEELRCGHCGACTVLGVDRMSCPQCSVTLPMLGRQHRLTRTITCPGCQSQFDLSAQQPVLLTQFATRKRPRLPHRLGDRFRLRGQDYRLIGHLRFRERYGASTWTWDEFLMLPTPVPPDAHGLGCRWLVLERGEYQWLTPMRQGPEWNVRRLDSDRTWSHAGVTYKPSDDEPGRAQVTWVEGEMPWVAQEGDLSHFADFHAAPRGLCAEWTDQEIEWFSAEHLPRAAVAQAFAIPEAMLPPQHGVGLLEPFHWKPWHREALLAAVVAVVVLFIGIMRASSGREAAQVTLGTLPPVEGGQAIQAESLARDGVLVSRPFTITEAPVVVAIEASADPPQNGWVAAGAELVHLGSTGQLDDVEAPSASADLEFWHESGQDDEGPWSESQHTDRALVRIDEPGSYCLRAVIERSDGPVATNMQVRVLAGVGITRWYWLAALLIGFWSLTILALPVLHGWRRDHPPDDRSCGETP